MKKNILVITEFFYPCFRAGGPAKSSTNLLDFYNQQPSSPSFDVVTSPYDLGGFEVNTEAAPTRFSRSKFYYENGFFNLLKKYLSILNKYDVVYINSFFNFKYSILPLIIIKLLRLNVDIILAPRGELSIGAMELKSLKKKIYLYIFNTCIKSNRMKFHYTSLMERDEADLYVLGIKYLIAPNMHDPAPNFIKKNKQRNKVTITYLSRVTEKKQLDKAIKLIGEVDSRIKIDFKVAGEVDDNKYWEYCLYLASKLNDNINFEYLGALDKSGVGKCLSDSHFFILPTRNENYGHAIVEAMAHSVIPILSKKTPWSDVSSSGGIVSDFPVAKETLEKIEQLLASSDEEYNTQSYLVYKFIINKLKNNENQIKEMFS